MDLYLHTAIDHARQLAGANEELVISDELPTVQGSTNRVVYGSRCGSPVVLKFFGDPNRKRHEEWALQRLSASGLVPRVYPYESDNLLVMDRLPGTTLWELRETLSTQDKFRIQRQIGKRLATIAKTSPRSESAADGVAGPSPISPDVAFFWKSDFATFFDTTMETCRAALVRHAIPHDDLHRSIRGLIDRRDDIIKHDSFLHCDDVHANNIIVNEGRLQGFIDLEMSRFGNELYLLGTVLQNATLQDPPNPDHWRVTREGYEEERGKTLDSDTLALVRLFAPFQNWIRFSWYWGTDNLPAWAVEGNLRQSTLNSLCKTLANVDAMI